MTQGTNASSTTSSSTSRSLLAALLLMGSAGTTAQASTIFDFWNLDRESGLAWFDGREHQLRGLRASQADSDLDAGSERARLLATPVTGELGREGGSRGSAAATSIGSAGAGGLGSTYSDLRFSAAQGGGGVPSDEGLRIAVTGTPGASLQLERVGSGSAWDSGEASLFVCTSGGACGAVEQSASSSSSFMRTGDGVAMNGFRSASGGSASESDLIMIASLAEPVGIRGVDAPEPSTFLPLGLGLVVFGAVKGKKAVRS